MAPSEVLVVFPTAVGVALGLGEEPLCVFGLALGEHLEPIFGEHVILHLNFGCAGIQLERILISFSPTWVEAIKQPLTAVDGEPLLASTSSASSH